MDDWVAQVLKFAEHSPYLGLFALLIFGGVGLPFPEDGVLTLCGVLIAADKVKPLYALPVVYTGMLIGDFIIYSFGKKYGRSIVRHPRFRKVVTEERLAGLEERFHRQGALFVILGRHVVGLRAQMFLISGIMGMAPLKFVAADAVAAIITMTLMTGMGYLGGNSLQALKRDLWRVEHVALLIIVIALIGYVLFRYFRLRRMKVMVK